MAAPGVQMKHGSIRKIKNARESPFPASKSSEPGQRQCSAVPAGSGCKGRFPAARGNLAMYRNRSKNATGGSLSLGRKSPTLSAEVFQNDFFGKIAAAPEKQGTDPGKSGRKIGCIPAGSGKVGIGSFPKLKIPHQSHADFCSTDTAGGLDNKKRRYAPRGGVAYRLFLWGFPKGATPPFGTRLCEAKCSVLYALSALP